MEDELTAFVESGTSSRMGRPPLNNKPTLVRLSEEDRQRIEALVGPRGMAEFIREAVVKELKRREAHEKSSQPARPSQVAK